MIFCFSSYSNRADGGKVGIPPRTALCTRAREPTSWKQIPSLSLAPSPGPGWMCLIVRGGEIELGRELGARNLFPSSPRSPPCRARCRPRARLSKLASGPQARRARQSAAAAEAFRPVGPGARMLVTSPPDRAPPVWELISPSIIPQMFALIPSW